MILYLDTADINEVEKYAFMINGITTTPTIIKRSNVSTDDFVNTVRTRFPSLEIHIEALGNTAKDIERIIDEFCSKAWYKEDKVAFKVPINIEGLKATKNIKKKNNLIKINLHMVFSAAQASLAMQVGADYIAPLIGRYADRVAELDSHSMRAKGSDAGYELLKSTNTCKKSIGSNSIILASSIRTVHDFVTAVELGSDAVTLPPNILELSINHPMTTEGVEILWKDLD